MKKLSLFALLLLASFSVAQADLKIAVVDLGKAFDQYYKTKDASQKLEDKKAGYQKEIQDLVTEFQQMQSDAEKLHEESIDPTLSQAAQKDKAAALNQKNQDLLNMRNKIQEMETERSNEIKDELVRRHKEIVDEITKVIDDYSVPQGFDLVIDKSSASAASGVPIIIYNSNKLIDITDEIIRQLNSTAPPAGAAPTGIAPTPATGQ